MDFAFQKGDKLTDMRGTQIFLVADFLDES